MIDGRHIGGILFDYGGTIDSNGMHWGDVIRLAYEAENIVFPDRTVFRDAYVHGERTLGRNPIVRPHHTFADMMHLKIRIQFDRLKENGFLHGKAAAAETAHSIANRCYEYAARSVEAARPVIAALTEKYRIALVSNFYGNLNAVLDDFRLRDFFSAVIESAVVGVRKPDPQIFRLGVEALHLPPDEVAVVGDSYDKDIVPSTIVGCRTVWLKKTGWNDCDGRETADAIISDFPELSGIFLND
ncbi:MAG: HAD family hydrolase [Tannerella sp.]|jgi:putative hydrolase of the HAD superfamily|nr:HAD family hydrolase [Tannerella sp.]